MDVTAGPLLVLGGPTASGKTGAGVLLAKKLGAEIISADSVQFYKGFDIGAAKPDKSELAAVPHHMIDTAGPFDTEYTVVRFNVSAGKIARTLIGEGKLPLVVGGSGLYIKSLLENFSGAVKVNDEAERKMDDIVETKGQIGLHYMAMEIDPAWTIKVHANDTFRTRRIVGVYLTCGKRMSDLFAERPTPSPFNHLMVVLQPERADLYRRIEERVDHCLANGWRDEVKTLIKLGYTRERRAMKSLGYKILYAELEGEHDPDQSAGMIKKETKAFAKRQVTWFRKVKGAVFIPVNSNDTPETVANSILERDEVRKFLDSTGL